MALRFDLRFSHHWYAPNSVVDDDRETFTDRRLFKATQQVIMLYVAHQLVMTLKIAQSYSPLTVNEILQSDSIVHLNSRQSGSLTQ